MERFTILGEIGKGSFGTVYRAKNNETASDDFAIKKVSCDAPENIELALQEFWTLSRLQKHLNIIRFEECSLQHGRDIGLMKHGDQTSSNYLHLVEMSLKGKCSLNNGSYHLWFVMEYCDGGDMNDFLLSRLPITTLNSSFILQLADGIAFLHKNNVVHRDLKPENVLVRTHPTGTATKTSQVVPTLKIADFGLSKVCAGKETNPQTNVNNCWLSSACGSDFFMAPEMFEGHYTAKADVFALGIMFWAIMDRITFVDAGTKKVLLGTYVRKDKDVLPVGEALLEDPKLDIADLIYKTSLRKPVGVPRTEGRGRWKRSCTCIAGNKTKLRGLVAQMVAHNAENRPSSRQLLQRLKAIIDRKSRFAPINGALSRESVQPKEKNDQTSSLFKKPLKVETAKRIRPNRQNKLRLPSSSLKASNLALSSTNEEVSSSASASVISPPGSPIAVVRSKHKSAKRRYVHRVVCNSCAKHAAGDNCDGIQARNLNFQADAHFSETDSCKYRYHCLPKPLKKVTEKKSRRRAGKLEKEQGTYPYTGRGTGMASSSPHFLQSGDYCSDIHEINKDESLNIKKQHRGKAGRNHSKLKVRHSKKTLQKQSIKLKPTKVIDETHNKKSTLLCDKSLKSSLSDLGNSFQIPTSKTIFSRKKRSGRQTACAISKAKTKFETTVIDTKVRKRRGITKQKSFPLSKPLLSDTLPQGKVATSRKFSCKKSKSKLLSAVNYLTDNPVTLCQNKLPFPGAKTNTCDKVVKEFSKPLFSGQKVSMKKQTKISPTQSSTTSRVSKKSRTKPSRKQKFQLQSEKSDVVEPSHLIQERCSTQSQQDRKNSDSILSASVAQSTVPYSSQTGVAGILTRAKAKLLQAGVSKRQKDNQCRSTLIDERPTEEKHSLPLNLATAEKGPVDKIPARPKLSLPKKRKLSKKAFDDSERPSKKRKLGDVSPTPCYSVAARHHVVVPTPSLAELNLQNSSSTVNPSLRYSQQDLIEKTSSLEIKNDAIMQDVKSQADLPEAHTTSGLSLAFSKPVNSSTSKCGSSGSLFQNYCSRSTSVHFRVLPHIYENSSFGPNKSPPVSSLLAPNPHTPSSCVQRFPRRSVSHDLASSQTYPFQHIFPVQDLTAQP